MLHLHCKIKFQSYILIKNVFFIARLLSICNFLPVNNVHFGLRPVSLEVLDNNFAASSLRLLSCRYKTTFLTIETSILAVPLQRYDFGKFAMLHLHGKATAYQNGLENLKPNVDSNKTISQFCLPFSFFISSKLLGYSRDCFPYLLD